MRQPAQLNTMVRWKNGILLVRHSITLLLADGGLNCSSELFGMLELRYWGGRGRNSSFDNMIPAKQRLYL
jgi:hypothetical protein